MNDIALRGFLRDISFSHYQGAIEYEKANLICPRTGGKEEDVMFEVAMQYNTGYNENIYSFVNNINTHDGGTHEEGVRRALTRVINSYARKTNLLKEKDESLTGDDVKEGLTMIISCKHPNPQFEGQTKGRLGNSEVRKLADSVFSQGFEKFLLENPDEA